MADKIIVVKENREGCFLQTLNIGCALVFAIIGVVVFLFLFGLYKASEGRERKKQEMRAIQYQETHMQQDAQEAVSTPSAQKPTNDTPKPLAKPSSAAQPPAIIEPDEKPIREVRETETTCSSCSGRGTIPATVTCSKCAGAGRIYKAGKWQKCPKTMKRGTKPCPTCSGTGKIRTLE